MLEYRLGIGERTLSKKVGIMFERSVFCLVKHARACRPVRFYVSWKMTDIDECATWSGGIALHGHMDHLFMVFMPWGL